MPPWFDARVHVMGQAEAAAYSGCSVREIRRRKNVEGMQTTDWRRQTIYFKAELDRFKANEGKGMRAVRDRDVIASAGIKAIKEKRAQLELDIEMALYHRVSECEARQNRKVVDLTRGLDAMRRKVESRVPAKVRAEVGRVLKEEIKHMRKRFAGPL